MTLTKTEIVDSIDKKVFLHKNKVSESVEILLEIIKKALESGEDVMISGFGKFCVKEKDKRKERDPATARSMTLGKDLGVILHSSLSIWICHK